MYHRAWWLMLIILLLEGKVLEAYGGTWGSYPSGLGHPATAGMENLKKYV
jgi:hypothetical protein